MRVNSRWLAALFLMAVIPLTGCGFINKLRARDDLNKGVKEFTDQKYDTAAQFFQKSMELDPEMEEPRVYLATAYMLQFMPGSMDPKNDQYAEKAIATFKDVIERSEKKGKPNVNAMLAIANLSYQLKDIDQTREWCKRILALPATTEDEKKNQAEAYYRIAVMLFDNVHERLGIVGEYVDSLTPEDKEQILEYINEGLDDLEKAIEIRPKYYDAMMYQNLLWREQEKLVTDKEAKAELIKKANIAYTNAVKLKLADEQEKASKFKTLNLGE